METSSHTAFKILFNATSNSGIGGVNRKSLREHGIDDIHVEDKDGKRDPMESIGVRGPSITSTSGARSIESENEVFSCTSTSRDAAAAPSATATSSDPTTDSAKDISTEASEIDVYVRTTKVAKLRLSDHGSHGVPTPAPGEAGSHILKRLTQHLSSTYEGLGSGAAVVVTSAWTGGNGSASTAALSGRESRSKKRMSPCYSPHAQIEMIKAAKAATATTPSNKATSMAAVESAPFKDPQIAFPVQPQAGMASSAAAVDARPSPLRPHPSKGQLSTETAGTADSTVAKANVVDVSMDKNMDGAGVDSNMSESIPSERGGIGNTAASQNGTVSTSVSTVRSTSRSAAAIQSKIERKSLLTAALEGADNKLQKPSKAKGIDNGQGKTNNTEKITTPKPISSRKETRKEKVKKGQHSSPSKKGKCLTNPSVSASNGGLDNGEGNLIVRVGDILRIPNRNVQVHKRRVGRRNSSNEDDNVIDIDDESFTEYEVLDLLGQGTFAQVFRCLVLCSGEVVAVKVVKNKPAYTRQAAVEIDVFRSLSEAPPSSWTGDGKGDATGTAGMHRSQSVTTTTSKGQSSVQKEGGTANSEFSANGATEQSKEGRKGDGGATSMVDLLCYFMHQSHLCLVFELLGANLYEVLKKRQFRGLPLAAVQSLVQQALEGVKDLSCRNIVHCDLKPENILLCDEDAVDNLASAGKKVEKEQNIKDDQLSSSSQMAAPHFSYDERIKLIDFGSACFEGKSAHTYIQSRFYRSPEVLVGLEYDSAIDMWSLGCVAAELYLGLPILPGVHEHDQLGRICEMIGDLPEWMLDQGSKANKYFVKFLPKSPPQIGLIQGGKVSPPARHRPAWRLKTLEEYISSLSAEEAKRRGGISRLEQQPTNRYFKRKKLADIVELHGHCSSSEDKEKVKLFVHFLKGILDPDPWKRWTANQASMHPFVTHSPANRQVRDTGNSSVSRRNEVCWNPPWDSSICKRKLLAVQKAREKQPGLRSTVSRGSISGGNSLTHQHLPEGSVTDAPMSALGQALDSYAAAHPHAPLLSGQHPSPGYAATSRVTAMTDAMSLSQSLNAQPGIYQQSPANVSISDIGSPSSALPGGLGLATPSTDFVRAGSLGTALGSGAPPYGVSVSSAMSIDSTGNTHFNMNVGGTLTDQGMGQISGLPPVMIAQGSNQQGNIYSIQNFPLGTGAQSFSGVYQNSAANHQMNIGGDLGYALQRPGVVPGGLGLGSDPLSGVRQQVTPLQYLQQQHQQQQMLHPPQPSSVTNIGRPGSFGGIAGASPAGRHIYGPPQATAASSLGTSHYLEYPRSTTINQGIRIDTLSAMNRSPQRSSTSGISLLSQQLADNSASIGSRPHGHGLTRGTSGTGDNLVGNTMSFSTSPNIDQRMLSQQSRSYIQPSMMENDGAYSDEAQVQAQAHAHAYSLHLQHQEQEPNGTSLTPSVVVSRLQQSYNGRNGDLPNIDGACPPSQNLGSHPGMSM